MMYTKAQLKELLALATMLGFEDDIQHWKSELKKLEG